MVPRPVPHGPPRCPTVPSVITRINIFEISVKDQRNDWTSVECPSANASGTRIFGPITAAESIAFNSQYATIVHYSLHVALNLLGYSGVSGFRHAMRNSQHIMPWALGSTLGHAIDSVIPHALMVHVCPRFQSDELTHCRHCHVHNDPAHLFGSCIQHYPAIHRYRIISNFTA